MPCLCLTRPPTDTEVRGGNWSPALRFLFRFRQAWCWRVAGSFWTVGWVFFVYNVTKCRWLSGSKEGITNWIPCDQQAGCWWLPWLKKAVILLCFVNQHPVEGSICWALVDFWGELLRTESHRELCSSVPCLGIDWVGLQAKIRDCLLKSLHLCCDFTWYGRNQTFSKCLAFQVSVIPGHWQWWESSVCNSQACGFCIPHPGWYKHYFPFFSDYNLL